MASCARSDVDRWLACASSGVSDGSGESCGAHQRLQEQLHAECDVLRGRVDSMLEQLLAQQTRTLLSYVEGEDGAGAGGCARNGPLEVQARVGQDRVGLFRQAPGPAADARPRREPPVPLLAGPGGRREAADGTTSTETAPWLAGPGRARKVQWQPPKVAALPSLHPHLETLQSFTSSTSSVLSDPEKTGFGCCLLPDVSWLMEFSVECLESMYSVSEPARSGCLFDFVYSRSWTLLCTLVIALNGVFAIVATDHEVDHYLNPQVLAGASLTTVAVIDLAFLVFYTVEIGLKLLLHKTFFFINSEWKWNIFDLLLVIVSMIDAAISIMIVGSENQVDVGFMRSLRVLKLAKILRIIRLLHVVEQLRLIMQSVMGSLVSLFWSFIVILFILYIFGVVFVQGVTNHYAELRLPLGERIEIMFGSVSSAMLTLYMAANGGYDWEVVYRTIADTGARNAILFLIYIIFIQIAVLNIVTGVFVENAMKLAQPDHEMRAQQEYRQELKDASDLRQICWDIDKDGNGRISVDEFCQAYMHSRKIRAHFLVLGLDINDAKIFFDLLSDADDGEAELDIEVFVAYCLRLRGKASSIDLHQLLLESRLSQKEQQQFNAYCSWKLEQLASSCSDDACRRACCSTSPLDMSKAQRRVGTPLVSPAPSQPSTSRAKRWLGEP